MGGESTDDGTADGVTVADAEDADDGVTAGAALDPRRLRSMVEFAVLIAQEGQKFKPPLTYPGSLKRYFGADRVPSKALSGLVRAIDRDDRFRDRIAAGAIPDREAAHTDAVNELKRAEKRRDAAERATVRARAEVVSLQAAIGDRDELVASLRTDVAKLSDEADALRAELVDTRTEARHARDREQSALGRLAASEDARAAAEQLQGAAETVRDGVLADRAALAAERSELARLAAQAESLATQLAALSSPDETGAPAPVRRKALPMPGGVMGDSSAAADYLMRSGASVLIDGYNVAKLAWPKLDLEGQRVVLLDAVENLARRYGSDMTVVFDGADVVGAATDQRRIVRVVYSPADVIADDVIRDEVRRLPPTRQVVVVTNDREIVGDVRGMGANTMTSDQLLTLIK
jgi:predicted RNA-binding protein with PIN domain